MIVESQNWRWFRIFFIIRLVMAILSKSYHHGDETYQSVEVAHKLVFGRGHLAWEWTSPNPIRSYLYPFLFASIFGILKVFGIDSAEKPVHEKAEIWERFSKDWQMDGLDDICQTVNLDGMLPEIDKILAGGQTGRVVLEL